MKVRITQEKFAQALLMVGRVATTRSALPVLANVLIKATKSGITFITTNLEIAITHSVTGKVEESGSVTVPARLLSDYVNSLPAEPVDLSLENNKLTIESGSYSSVMNGMSAEEFPALPKISNGSSITVPVSDLKTGIQQTIMAASSDETRPILTGGYFHTYEKSVYIVATDSYRLAQKQLVSKAKEDFSLVIPATALNDMVRIIGDNTEGDVAISYDEAQVQFKFGDSQLITRQIDGTFPAYRQLIPENSEVSIKIDKSELHNITKVASLFARESAGSITLEVSDKDQTVNITSVASQVGQNTSTAKAKVNGSGKVTLNSRYLLEALGAVNSKTVEFRFSGKISPCVLTPVGDSNDYLHVIMPLKS